MAELVADCPRCVSTRMTFDVTQVLFRYEEYGWKRWYEAFSICRNCTKSTTFVLAQKANEKVDMYFFRGKSPLDIKNESLNNFFEVEGYISLRDMAPITAPEHLPIEIADAFKEGAASLSIQCWNAAGTMFRLCIDLSTKSLLPDVETPSLNHRTRRDLGLRLPWLFENGMLPPDLRELSRCIHQDGNDGAHAGTLKKADAEDLLDFTLALLTRLFTEPKKLQLAAERRQQRRAEQA
jgi:hypothetical protein